MSTNETKLRPLAVVTGASSGIGYELAKQFATNGYDLVVCADSDRIGDAAARLESLGGQVEVAQADLSRADGVELLYEHIRGIGRPVDAIAINAGVGVNGAFLDTDIREEIRMINLNVISTVHLAKLVARDMVARGSGKILITASVAGTMPSPFLSVYGATKAFDLMFAESLRNELKDTGVTVTALLPGATNTNFFDRAGMQDTKVGTEGKYENSPEDVAKQGFEALMSGKDHVVAASFKTKFQQFIGNFIPDSVKANQHRAVARPGSAEMTEAEAARKAS